MACLPSYCNLPYALVLVWDSPAHVLLVYVSVHRPLANLYFYYVEANI